MGLDSPWVAHIEAPNATSLIYHQCDLILELLWIMRRKVIGYIFLKVRRDLPNPKMPWLFENNPGLQELVKFVAVLTGVDPVFSPEDLFSLIITSGKSFFPEKATPASAAKFSALVAFALSQLTTSLNFSWNNTTLQGQFFPT